MKKKWKFHKGRDEEKIEVVIEGSRENNAVAIRLQDRWGKDSGPLIIEIAARTYYISMSDVSLVTSEDVETGGNVDRG